MENQKNASIYPTVARYCRSLERYNFEIGRNYEPVHGLSFTIDNRVTGHYYYVLNNS